LIDEAAMRFALEAAAAVRTSTSPNPWVGAVVLSSEGQVTGAGATEPPGGAHAEVLALRSAGASARGGTLVVTLEPCAHHGRTPPCVDAVIAAGIRRVVVGVVDPDARVAGRGVVALRAAGIEVTIGVLEDEVRGLLEPYLTHRCSGRPYVVCKLGVTLDGMIAAADGTSQWITGAEARVDAHRLRAESDAVVVGVGTVRRDDPSLTVRHVAGRDPLRVVLGSPPAAARIHPCLAWTADIPSLLHHLGERGVLQVLVEGGSRVVRSLVDLDLVDRFVLYVAPAMFLGRDATPMVGGPSVPTIGDLHRMQFVGVRRVGTDVRLDVVPKGREAAGCRAATGTVERAEMPAVRFPGEVDS
jgi:diaminohydroxyphosphoribosylaminopyrimidine deaminase/5-amino-6-(5-phosphoribosylamino)uracil reductase